MALSSRSAVAVMRLVEGMGPGSYSARAGLMMTAAVAVVPRHEPPLQLLLGER
jgi:hypothetical protein